MKNYTKKTIDGMTLYTRSQNEPSVLMGLVNLFLLAALLGMVLGALNALV